ncbi:hypothetical protein Q1695_000545 [Nippostrongylus brasiliensis]|nr:hypothetical protein Q1695_000545 [Nippostrongylus brasiliensis]
MLDEIDRQILQVCADTGCSFYRTDLVSLEQLTQDNIVEFLTRCLWLISPSSRATFPLHKSPFNALQRYKIASALADSFKASSVRRNFGYQSLLYGNAAELRQIFVELIEKIPKDTFSQLGGQYVILRSLRGIQQKELRWMPEFCRNRSHRETHCWVQREDCPEAFSLASTTAFRDSREVLASIIVSSESSGPVKLTRMKPPTAARKRIPNVPCPAKSQEQNVVISHDEQPDSDCTIELTAEILRATAEKQGVLEKMHVALEDSRAQCSSRKYMITKNEGIVEFLTSTPERQAVILSKSDETDESLMRKAELKFQQSKEELHRKLKEGRTIQQEQRSEVHERYVKCREKLNDIRGQIEQRSQHAKKVKSHLERERTHVVDRGLIVRLIAETIAGMQKQDAEILKVFSDIKSVQRELKWVSQTLYRAFNPIEDVLFEDVEDRKGERAYKLFGRLHVSCLNSVEAIERNGALLRQNEELVDLVEAEQQRQFAQQLQRICRDAEDVIKENERLEELLK